MMAHIKKKDGTKWTYSVRGVRHPSKHNLQKDRRTWAEAVSSAEAMKAQGFLTILILPKRVA